MRRYLTPGKRDRKSGFENAPEKLRVMVAGPVFGGSLPVASYTSSALRRAGHTVRFLDFSEHYSTLDRINNLEDKNEKQKLKTGLVNALSRNALAAAEGFRPHLFLVLAQAPINPEIITVLRQAGIATAYWFIENYRLLKYWKSISKFYDFFFTIQKNGFFDLLDQAGARNTAFLPTGCDPQIHRPIDLNEEEWAVYGSDISFAGAAYFNRLASFSLLKEKNLKLWGVDWDVLPALKQFVQNNGKRFSIDEMVKIFSGSKISLNLHSSQDADCVDENGDFLNPRLFELSACSGFQLCDTRKDINDYFIPGREIVLFKDQRELMEKIDYYLENEKERSTISNNARKRAIKDHTYDNRLTEMLDFIFSRYRY